MDLARATMMARLARWLGPWADDRTRPKVDRRCVRLEGREAFDAWVYRPLGSAPRGALLVVPGLHYLGPADPRLDRFIAVLADSGILALCPFLPEFRRLRVGASLVDDTMAAYDALLALPDLPHARPGVFSVSFGSFPAIHVAADRDPAALVLFGGYADFEDAIRFSLEGAPDRACDPLNRPVVFLNFIEHFDHLPDDREPLRRAWITLVRRTWGQIEMKEGGWLDVAREIAPRLPESLRHAFLVGAGAAPGGDEMFEGALKRAIAGLRYLDPRRACSRVTCPVTLVHGQDDDVIPHTQSALLAEAMPGARLLVTGLYSHTGSSTVDPRAAIEEGRTMLGIIDSIADAALRGSLPSGSAQTRAGSH